MKKIISIILSLLFCSVIVYGFIFFKDLHNKIIIYRLQRDADLHMQTMNSYDRELIYYECVEYKRINMIFNENMRENKIKNPNYFNEDINFKSGIGCVSIRNGKLTKITLYDFWGKQKQFDIFREIENINNPKKIEYRRHQFNIV